MSEDISKRDAQPKAEESESGVANPRPEHGGEVSDDETKNTYYPFYIPVVADWLDTKPHKIWRRFKRNANALLVIATILILCVYYGQLKQMRKSTRAATKYAMARRYS